MKKQRWTPKQLKELLDGIGSFGWQVLQRRTGARSRPAITQKIKREFGGGGITRGSYSLEQAMAETGYARTQLIRAAKALNQRWPRTSKGGNYLITEVQLEEMAAWLSQDYWARKQHLYACLDCGTRVRPHRGGGLCAACYSHNRRLAAAVGMSFRPDEKARLPSRKALRDGAKQGVA